MTQPASPADGRASRRFGARWMALLAATLIALYLCWRMVQPFIEVLLWATVLVIVFYPVHWRLLQRTRRPGLAAALSTAIVVLTVLVPLTLVTLAIAGEAVDAVEALQRGVRQVLDPNTRVHQMLSRWVDIEEFAGGEWKKAVAEMVQDRTGAIAGRTFAVLGAVLGVVLKLFFVVFTMYYFFRDGERVKAALHDVLPLEWEQSHAIFERTKEVIQASIYGVLVIAFIQGALGGLAFWFLGLPSPLMWGAVMFLLSMVPMVGSAFVWAPAAVFLLFTGHYYKAAFLVVWGAVVIGMIDNLLRPRLVGGRTRMHELLVFFSVVGGLPVFGVLGIVVGPVVVAITMALLDVFRQVERPSIETLREPTVMEQQDRVREVPEEGRPPEARVVAEAQTALPLSPVLRGEGGGEGPVPTEFRNAKPPTQDAPHPRPLP